MEWTSSQKEAISYQGENILLSAAAGSGKTAVLVQRVIEKILDQKNPVSVSELLILTFTEAAAAEMKHKISDAINREFAKNPQNKHLKNQRILINSANISTVHSFCLEVIKGNIHKTDIPVNFTIIPEIDNAMLREKALDAVLARFYEDFERIPSFQKLVLGYGSDKGDSSLRDILLKVMNFALSMPYPAKWLSRSAAEYKFADFSASVWHKRLFEYAEKSLNRIIDIYDEILKSAEQYLAQDHPYPAFFALEREKFVRIADCIKEKDYDKTRQGLIALSFDRLPVKKVTEPDAYLAQDNIKNFRALAKKRAEELKGLFSSDKESAAAQIRETEPLVRTFKNIILITLRLYKRMKRRQSYLDFNDLEHELIGLLADKEGKPTEVAKSLREKYKEILVDEYQDTNYIQEAMFRLISRNETNIFMVGDIKQSIYKFRNAVPDLFAEKYDMYGGGEKGHLIKLAKNFRSREEVIDSVNFIFEKIMSRETGGVNYGADERLEPGAAYPQGENPESYITEFNIVNGREAEDPARAEAAQIARRIRNMVEGKELIISDPETGAARPVRYRDLVILMRNTKSTAPVFEEVFEEFRIPLYSESGRSYLTTTEVQTVLSFLQIIDNPCQDIPLIAVLRSPLWRFNADMLAKIRAKKRGGVFYEAVTHAAENGDVSCARFVSELNSLRDEAEFMSVSDLVMAICNRYNYSAIAAGMAGGEQRAENLRLLYERAAEYDTARDGSLSGFMLYIETILSMGQDLSPAEINGENSDAVRIMSIHKSKGLEFPVVILANAFGQFNKTDISKSFLWHDRLGFGLRYVDTEKRVIYPSIPHKIIAGIALEELIAEEMRLLYVAMTRAKEKLIISAVIKSRTTAWASPYLAQDSMLTAGILNATSLGDWICHALARHTAAEVLYDEFKLHYPPSETEPQIRITLTDEETTRETAAELTADVARSSVVDDELYAKLANNYPNSESGAIPIKMSVSEAKRRLTEEEIYTPHVFTIPTISARNVERISATDRGTITHFVLQHIDMDKTNSAAEIDGEIRRMTDSGIISPSQSEAVDRASLLGFFNSPLGLRLKNAQKVWKEFNFYTETPAADFYPHIKSGEKILLQGTMDCFFREKDGKMVLIDYKTDRIGEDEIESRSRFYLTQLKYYKSGLEAISGETNIEAYIYFLGPGKAVHIDDIGGAR